MHAYAFSLGQGKHRKIPVNKQSGQSAKRTDCVCECMSRPKEATVFDPNSNNDPSRLYVCAFLNLTYYVCAWTLRKLTNDLHSIKDMCTDYVMRCIEL